MNCLEFDHWLETATAARDGELSPVAAAHLAVCDSCDVLWRQHLLLNSRIDRWRELSISPDLTSRVLQELGTVVPTGEPSTRMKRRAWSALSTLAALGLVALVTVAGLMRIQPENTADNRSAGEPVPTSLSELYAAVRQEWPQKSAAAVNLAVTTQPSRDTNSGTDWHMPTMAASLPAVGALPTVESTVNLMEQGLRPLGEGVGQAFGFLRAFVPDETDSAS